jgi:tricorn protease
MVVVQRRWLMLVALGVGAMPAAAAEVLLRVSPTPNGADGRDVQIKTLTPAEERVLRYRDWCRRNREAVDAASDGHIGCVHIPDMGGEGLVGFIKRCYPQINKDALVLDLRYNRGGFVSQMIIERLARTVWAYMSPRRGALYIYPERVHCGYKAVIINALAGSDGDIFPESFKLKKLGPVIGERTWGGVIGVRMDKPFIDGGMSSQPEFAWWAPGIGWGLENRGVEPDIPVPFTPEDCIADRDPQLDRAIQVLLDQLKREPIKTPEPPPYPDKALKQGEGT